MSRPLTFFLNKTLINLMIFEKIEEKALKKSACI